MPTLPTVYKSIPASPARRAQFPLMPIKPLDVYLESVRQAEIEAIQRRYQERLALLSESVAKMAEAV